MTAAIKSLNKSNGKYGFNDLFSSVQSVGNVSKATDLIARYGKEANSKAVYNALVKAYGKENITSEMMAKIGYTAKNKTGKVGGGNTGIGFLNSAKELGSGVATVLSSIASYVSTMNKLMSEYGDNEIAMQAILKLSLDPSMANASYDEWKSAIEDTEVQVRLDANEQDLENLSKDLTRLQTDASDMQTLMNNKSAFNQKATAQDYNNLVENGNAQISNLNKQIKDYQDNIRTIRESKGISPLTDEDNEKIKGYQDQIQSAQMSIENMKASQAGWLEDIQNLPITNVSNLSSALNLPHLLLLHTLILIILE